MYAKRGTAMSINFGEKLRQERSKLRLSQERLAELSRYDKAHISNLERSKKAPSVDAVDRLAEALNIPPAELVAGTEVAGKYAAARVSPNDWAIQEHAERRRQSQKIVTLHEIYRRIMELHQGFLVGQILDSPDALSEAYIQHLGDLLAEASDDAAELLELSEIKKRLYVLDSLDPRKYLIDNFAFDNDYQAFEEQEILKSEAVILKGTLRYPEADNDADRQEIAARLKLNRVDAHIETLKTERRERTKQAQEDWNEQFGS